MTEIPTRSLRLLARLALSLLAACLAAPLVSLAQAPMLEADGRTINAPRPVMDLALLLEARYRKPVTYEEPVWQWSGDSDPAGRDDNTRAVKWESFLLPEGLTPAESPALDAALVGRALDAYHSQHPDGTEFRVITSRLGLHIVPAKFHDASGRMVTASSLLDAYVRVPEQRRMASNHLHALCDALTAATGTPVWDGGEKWFDGRYAAGGVLPPKGAAHLLTEKEQEPFSFVWGTTVMTGRDALLSLLDRSSTTYSWELLCEPDGRPQKRFCVLNVVPISVPVVDADGKPVLDANGRPRMQAISYDRLNEPPKTMPRPAPEE